MTFKVSQKTGFISSAPLVVIYDASGAPFYVKRRKGANTTFNLPKGRYMIAEGMDLRPLPKPLKYTAPKLPAPERVIARPRRIQIFFGTNPNKATIKLEQGLIFLDNSIKIKTRPELEYVINHELGHYLYATEKYCDAYAAAQMLDQGYNPSQLYYSINGCLSDASKDRKEHINNFSKKVKI